uniref:AP-4 complex subunit mu-1-like n=1 Tax=Phallusia mammillata TaxID=59560 RepID=A0A6F9D769_9ASCI|nr:AP-4 complex subunit mu-1-like [Phallusia mammillata]
MLLGIFMASEGGEVIVRKDFLYSSTKWTPVTFTRELKRKGRDLPMSIQLEDMFYFHVKLDSVLLVAVTTVGTMSCYVVLAYLESLSDFLKDLLGTVNPQNIFSNIGLVYEVICESTDAGFPRLVEKEKLKTLLCNAVRPAKSNSPHFLSILPDNLFGAVGDANKRVACSEATKKPIKTKSTQELDKQELFVDLIEKLSVIIDSRGVVLHYGLNGKLQVKSYLDNAANVSVTFSQDSKLKDAFNNARFHANVDKSKLPREIRAQVCPGTYTAMNYSLDIRDESTSMPFTLYGNFVPVPEDKLVMINLKLHSSLPPRNPATNFVGTIRLPYSTLTASGSSSLANMELTYDKHKQLIQFTSPLYPGESHHSVSVKVLVKDWSPALVYELNSVVLEFEAPMFCQSGLRINNLKVESPNSTSSGPGSVVSRWVRYLTHSKSYEFYLKDDWMSIGS